MPPNPDRPATRGAGHASSRVAPYPRPEDRPGRKGHSDTGDHSGSDTGAGSSHGPRTTRQQYSACGACRMRRVKCNLKDVAVELGTGARPTCSNCQERGINCIDEYEKNLKPGKAKLLRRGRRIQGAEALFGKVSDTDSLDQASSIPDLAPEFFQSSFFHRLQIQRPIIEPLEFVSRYEAHFAGDSSALGHEGLLIAKVFVVWAAAFGLDETGKELVDAESPLTLTPPHDPLAAKREEWRKRVNTMVREILRLIDAYGILRKPTWDGVRALLLLLPLFVESESITAEERQVMQESAQSQIYTLCSLQQLPRVTLDNDHFTECLVRARVFWYAYVREGCTTGLRGGRLVVTEDDLDSFQQTLPRIQMNTPPVSRTQGTFQQARHFSQIAVEISSACRLAHVAVTGPRARQRMGESHIDESVLKQSWDALDGCWRKLDTLRTQYSHGQLPSEDTDRFVSGWQLFIFEAHNIIREALKQRLMTLETHRPYVQLPNNAALREHVKNLHQQALQNCNVALRSVMSIIKSHIDLAQSSPFFAYDASLVRDACYFAAMLLATSESGPYANEEDLRRDIDFAIHAARSTRFAYGQCPQRERSIETLWDSRIHRLHNARSAQARPPALNLSASNFYPAGSNSPSLSLPYAQTTNAAAWQPPRPMTIALHPAESSSTRAGYSSMPITPTTVGFSSTPTTLSFPPIHHASASAPVPSYAPYSTPPGSNNSRPSTSGEGQSAIPDASQGIAFSASTTPLEPTFSFAFNSTTFGQDGTRPSSAPTLAFTAESQLSLDMTSGGTQTYSSVAPQPTSMTYGDWSYSHMPSNGH